MQEDFLHFGVVVRGGGGVSRGTKIVNKHFVNRLAFSNFVGCRFGPCFQNSEEIAPIVVGDVDVLCVQETWLLPPSLPKTHRQAKELGYDSVFVPARAAQRQGRPSGGLAVLSRVGVPLLRAEKGDQWNKGRWMHAMQHVKSSDPRKDRKFSFVT